MKVGKEIITLAALIFGSFLSIILLKYLFYDSGFHFSNIILLICLLFTRIYLFKDQWKTFTEEVIKKTADEVIRQSRALKKDEDNEEEREKSASANSLSENKYPKEPSRLPEAACLLVFILFDRNLLSIGNIFLILGAASIREQLHGQEELKEISSFVCGLIYSLMGWTSVGRILIMYFFMMFYCYAILLIGMTIVSQLGTTIFVAIVQGIVNQIAGKLRGENDVKSDAVKENEKNE